MFLVVGIEVRRGNGPDNARPGQQENNLLERQRDRNIVASWSKHQRDPK